MLYKQIEKHYQAIKAVRDFSSPIVFNELTALTILSKDYLSKCAPILLKSDVPNKEYFSFSNGKKQSRAIRRDLFEIDVTPCLNFLKAVETDNYTGLNDADINRAAYTIAISFCAVVDLEKLGDQKTPGTFFEYFIGHCFAKRLKVNPSRHIEVLNLDMKEALPTDLIFDCGTNQPKFHVPIKTSTRERVIQVWAHQRVLDGVYGTGRFYGTLVCLSETKTDKKKQSVTEICLPKQWQLYQMFIAQMKRVYYLDLPFAYSKLNEQFPKIHVNNFSTFIRDTEGGLDTFE